jgi:archaellum component FlaF (FlaF/FlaG flagellin family)
LTERLWLSIRVPNIIRLSSTLLTFKRFSVVDNGMSISNASKEMTSPVDSSTLLLFEWSVTLKVGGLIFVTDLAENWALGIKICILGV